MDIDLTDIVECKECKWKGPLHHCKLHKNPLIPKLLHLACPQCKYPLAEQRNEGISLLQGNAVIQS